MTDHVTPSVIPETPEFEEKENSETDGVTVVPESLDIDDDTGNEPMEPTEELTEPAEELTEPTEELTEPTEEHTEPTEEHMEPTEKHMESTDSVEPTQASQNREEESTLNPARLFRLPLNTIKKIVKLDDDVHMANAEAVFLISKVTEHFIESLAVESFSYTTKNKKKTLMKNDVNTAINNVEALAFLDGAMEE